MGSVRGRGSSPRVRGKAIAYLRKAGVRGIIPAGAGKRLPRRSKRATRRDHPRGCGEKMMGCSPSLTTMGSSPRVRGKGNPALLNVAPEGIIPAGAGKSLHHRQAGVGLRDHPRGCGEKVSFGS